MMIRVLLFAYLRERCGMRESTIEVPAGSSAADLWSTLCRRFPVLATERPRFAVNQVYVAGGHRLRDNDEFAVIPPVSGG